MTGVIGINHSSAPVSIRERFTFDEEQVLCFAGMLQAVPEIKELVVLSTCNRTEVYYSIHGDCAEKAGNLHVIHASKWGICVRRGRPDIIGMRI